MIVLPTWIWIGFLALFGGALVGAPLCVGLICLLKVSVHGRPTLRPVDIAPSRATAA